MKLKRQRRFHAEVQTASLNDIMFFLLLFFLIVSTLGSPNVIRLMLPKTSESTNEVSKQPITLSITEDKRFFIDRKQINFPDLENAVLEATSGMEEPTVVLRAAESLTIQDLVDVMAIGARLKVRMVLATDVK
ncbi:ExbD/TolR family protein [Leadbetterella byssophila]|jgi:biopolymer transport protein ExbD|uniref:Biopolymer transport protein ExbD/TolR n=1 Tax=Leadbetterella byssophila (strain DSM 17132 / JCM 16389 / KACC 11308 / NBRC 106382 / 4M15) TaxID=649349 RepID=E4RWI1_LEAB4|nr:biopolymer transporter ExbD [Leadbetterella byssophila]ADQ18921.1 Biopolymer transport protein ExbD/TolR [Leadbetterella byssophila DSM 17132]